MSKTSEIIPGNPRACIRDSCKAALAAMNSPNQDEFSKFFRSKTYDPLIFQSYILYFMGIGNDQIANKEVFNKRLIGLTKLFHLRLSVRLYADILHRKHLINDSVDCPDHLKDGSYGSLLLLTDLEMFCRDKIVGDLSYLRKYQSNKEDFAQKEAELLEQQKQNTKRIDDLNKQIKILEERGIFLEHSPRIGVIGNFKASEEKMLERGVKIIEERDGLIKELENFNKTGKGDFQGISDEIKICKKKFEEFIKLYENFKGVEPADLIAKFNAQYQQFPALKSIEGKSEEMLLNPLLRPALAGSGFMELDNDSKKLFSLREFLHENCFNDEYGYYPKVSEDLGFTTIANAYQTQFGFAMCLLSKAINQWKDAGSPGSFMMVQLSGGNGELELSILSLAEMMANNSGNSEWKDFYQALNFRTIELTKSLVTRQQQMCDKYKSKFAVIQGDATDEKSWQEIAGFKAGAYCIFSNELLDMLFPEFYTLSKDGQIMKPHVVTKITNFEELKLTVRGFIMGDPLVAKQFEEICSRIKSQELNGIPASKIPGEIFIGRAPYEELIKFFHENKLEKEESINQYFKHQVVDFPIHLDAVEEKALRERLSLETPSHIRSNDVKRGDKYFFTDSVAIRKLYNMNLPHGSVYHFDYFSKPEIRDLETLRSYGDKGEQTVLKMSPDGGVEFIRSALYLCDTTHSVSAIKGFESEQHTSFVSSKDKIRLEEMGKTTGLGCDYFYLFSSLHKEMKYVEASQQRERNLVGPNPDVAVGSGESKKARTLTGSTQTAGFIDL